jgi:CO/xanthine dehydrogenase Mo-binding subunit
MSKDAFKVLGKITPRKDGMARVTGQERYVSDMTLPRMLHGRIVSSPYAHARVLSVDTRAAEALGAVCLTFADIPKLRYNERIVTVPWALHKDHTVLADKVRRMGEAVAAVAAETEALAERAVRAVRVEYEPLPVVTDPIEAMQPGAPALYDSVLLGDQELKIERNIACSRDILEGDPARAFAEAEVIVEGTFRTPKIYHAQMETKSVVCRPESDGGITVWPTTQSIHNLRILLGRGFHTSSAGAPQPGDVIDFSGALVKINQDGSVDVVTALMDHGGGTLEALARLVAETLCVPLDKVNISPGDTSTTVYDVVTHATRGVYAGGGAVVKVAREVRQELLETAARYLNVQPEALDLTLDADAGQGVVYAPALPAKRMTVGEIATRCWTDSWKTIAAVDSYRPVNCPPAYVSVFVEVEVDTWTGRVCTLRAVMGSDCGTVINPDMAAGQLEGGLSKGLGFALYEDNAWDAEGQLACKGYWVDAKMPAVSESPYVAGLATHFADTYEPSGPWGAKGLGEAATNPVAAAYANALYNALGVRFYELPITPEKILAALGAPPFAGAPIPTLPAQEAAALTR